MNEKYSPNKKTSGPQMLRPLKVSIIVPTFNKSSYLERLLPSILSQDFEPQLFELIIVDDGSTDNTARIAKNFSKKFENFCYVYQSRRGIGAARNTGLRCARGELISFLADDYVLEPTYLRKMSAAFENESIQGIRPMFLSQGHTPIELAMHIGMISDFKKLSIRAKQIIYRCDGLTSWGGASMTRRNVFDKFGLFLEDITTGEDTEYGIRLAAAGIYMHVYNEDLFKIKNRTCFFKANHRLFQYGFNGARLDKYIRNPIAARDMIKPPFVKPSLLFRLLRLIGRPLLNTFRYADDYRHALIILPFSYSLLISFVLGLLCGQFFGKTIFGRKPLN